MFVLFRLVGMLSVLWLLATPAQGQVKDTTTNAVVIHADPRLDVLMKRKQGAAIAATVIEPTPTARVANTAINGPAISVKPRAYDAPMVPRSVAAIPPARRSRTVVYSGKGFRVQIFNGTDRYKAMQVKMDFARSFPTVRSYLTYVAPNFRVKVGDYRYRTDAVGMLKEAKGRYGISMIVPDIVNVTAN